MQRWYCLTWSEKAWKEDPSAQLHRGRMWGKETHACCEPAVCQACACVPPTPCNLLCTGAWRRRYLCCLCFTEQETGPGTPSWLSALPGAHRLPLSLLSLASFQQLEPRMSILPFKITIEKEPASLGISHTLWEFWKGWGGTPSALSSEPGLLRCRHRMAFCDTERVRNASHFDHTLDAQWWRAHTESPPPPPWARLSWLPPTVLPGCT